MGDCCKTDTCSSENRRAEIKMEVDSASVFGPFSLFCHRCFFVNLLGALLYAYVHNRSVALRLSGIMALGDDLISAETVSDASSLIDGVFSCVYLRRSSLFMVARFNCVASKPDDWRMR